MTRASLPRAPANGNISNERKNHKTRTSEGTTEKSSEFRKKTVISKNSYTTRRGTLGRSGIFPTGSFAENVKRERFGGWGGCRRGGR